MTDVTETMGDMFRFLTEAKKNFLISYWFENGFGAHLTSSSVDAGGSSLPPLPPARTANGS